MGVALDDAAGRIYLTHGFNGAIGVVDIQAMKLVRLVPMVEKVDFAQTFEKQNFSEARKAQLLGMLKRFNMLVDHPYRLRELVVDPKNERVFAPGLGLGLDSVLVVMNTRTLEREKIVEGFGYNAVGIALDPVRGRVFVSNMRGQVFVVDARTLQITATLEVEADQLLNLAYDPAGNRLIGVDQGIDRDKARQEHLGREYKRRSEGHRVFVLDADTGRTLANMPSAEVPIGLWFDAPRQRLYVANRGGVRVKDGAGALTVYDMAGYTRLQTLPLAPHPNSVAFDAASATLFVTVKNDGSSKEAKKPESVVRVQLKPGQ
jgi:DNA-binding beta-propeller fold protein YncE